jgi:hypothetical protein
MPEWLKDIGRFDLPDVSDRDAASMLLPYGLVRILHRCNVVSTSIPGSRA